MRGVAWLVSVLILTTGGPAKAGWKALGPFGGAARAVAADGQEAGVFYAATENALVFRSRDNGVTWEPLPFPARLGATLHALAVDPKRGGLCFAALAGPTREVSGVLRTRDGGRTWEALPGMAGQRVWSLAVWGYDSRIIAAGTEDGVFLTRNSGNTWERISPVSNRELRPVVSLAFHPGDCRIIYAGTPHLPWKTRNQGETWTSIHSGMIDDSDVFSIQVDQARPETVYASACSGIYRSVNSGLRWRKLASARDASYRTYVITQDPRNPRTVYAGTTHGLVRSADGGATWRKLTSHATHSLAFDPRTPGRILAATSNAGIRLSEDGGATWRDSSRGFANYFFPFLAVSDQAWFTMGINESGGGGLFRSAGGGWEIVARTRVYALSGNWAASEIGVLSSRDGGRHWTPAGKPPGAGRLTSLVAPGARRMTVGTERGVFTSGDGGRRWERAPLSGAARVFKLSSGAVAAVSGKAIWVSTDHLRWTPWPALPAEAFAVESAPGGALLAATGLGLFRSEGPRQVWNSVPGPLGHTSVRALSASASGMAAATYNTVFFSRDGGKSWSGESEPEVPVGPVTGLTWAGHRLLVLTQRLGVFEIEARP